MTNSSNRFKALAWLSLTVAGLLALSVIILSGCTETLKGDENANKAPVVYFVNVPPDSASFSHNPEVYWFGSDIDGQIDYYRYSAVDSATVGSQTLADFAANLHDTMWTYVDVDPTASDPQTAHVIPLTADLTDPVNIYVKQFILLQAFDDDGAASAVAFKCLNRNDNPPATRLWSVTNYIPFVNAVSEGGIVTGVKLQWEGSDVHDYDEQGLIPPPFQFEWKLFGPFTEDDTLRIDSLFKEIVFVTPGGRVCHIGDTLVVCDLVMVEDDEGSHWEEVCDSIILDETHAGSSTPEYRVDTLLHIDSVVVTHIDGDDTTYTTERFPSDQVAARSWNGLDTWVYDTRDTLYDVFPDNDEYRDSTVSRFFIFWVRCRDDAMVPDPTPAFRSFPVINPRFERDILVIDLQGGSTDYRGILLSNFNKDYPTMMDSGFTMRKEFWDSAITRWDPSIEFYPYGDSNDYLHQSFYITNERIPLGKLLQYKLYIIVEDHSVFAAQGFNNNSLNYEDIFTGIDVGINAWVAGRSVIYGNPAANDAYAMQDAADYFRTYFGVEAAYYTQWYTFFQGRHPFNDSVKVRMEDFIGAYSMDEGRWPNLNVDPDLLRSRYYWDTLGVIKTLSMYCPWYDTIAALPEVGWCERAYGTEVMYLYKSRFGPNHFLGYPFTMEGAPVGHRYETNMFRTSWLMFTPYAFDAESAYDLVAEQLDWLYDPTIGQSLLSMDKRYPDATVKISLDEARVNADIRRTTY